MNAMATVERALDELEKDGVGFGAKGGGHKIRPWEIERMEETTLKAELEERGLHFRSPDELGDEELKDELWRLIRSLASVHVFIVSTNHLDDRALYKRLWDRELPLETFMPIQDEDDALVIDLMSGGVEDDAENYLKYYADEDEREDAAMDYPDIVVPAMEEFPRDRDSKLPAREGLTRSFVAKAEARRRRL